MPVPQLDFRYVETFLKNIGVRIKAEPGEYLVMRGNRFNPGPTHECRSFDNLHEAFAYGLHLALLPPFYRHRPKRQTPKPNSTGHNARAREIRRQQAEARRPEIEAQRAADAERRHAMIHAELIRLSGSS